MVGDGERGAVSRREFVRTATGGAGLAGASAVAGAQDGNETGGAGPSQNEQRQVEMTDNLRYVPPELTVAPGDTVEWVNTGSIPHTVTAYADGIPENADYFASGGFTSEEAARQGYPEGSIAGGESYSHTFETEGTYEYFCIPHEAAGMVGTVEVVPPGGAGGEQAPTGPVLPNSAKTIGIATTGALVSVLGLAYVFLKYGGDYGEYAEE